MRRKYPLKQPSRLSKKQPVDAARVRLSRGRILSVGLTWTMIAIGLTVAQTGQAGIQAPTISIGFEESEGFTSGSDIAEIEGWSSSGEQGGAITQDGSLFGEQSLRVEASEQTVEIGYQTGSVPQSGVRFIELGIKPVPLGGDEATARLNLWGSEIGFIRSEDDTVHLRLAGGEGKEPDGRTLATLAQVDVEGQGSRWLTFVIRQDLASATWDLFLDGTLAAVDLRMAESTNSLGIKVGPYEAMELDGIGIGTENPLFLDSDGDGMPDAYEIAHRLDPNVNDRNGDRDGDGVSNIAEYLAGTSPDVAGNGVTRQIIYVDNAIGRDSNSGEVSYGGESNGPKFSIKAAMAAAQNGAVIVVMPGTGIYNEGSRSAKGKRITIRTVKPIIIK